MNRWFLFLVGTKEPSIHVEPVTPGYINSYDNKISELFNFVINLFNLS